MSEVGFSCSVCSQQKAHLNVKKSRLMAGMNLYLCSECESEGREPRYLIILVGRSLGTDAVRKYIRQRKYVGEEILASELVK